MRFKEKFTKRRPLNLKVNQSVIVEKSSKKDRNISRYCRVTSGEIEGAKLGIFSLL